MRIPRKVLPSIREFGFATLLLGRENPVISEGIATLRYGPKSEAISFYNCSWTLPTAPSLHRPLGPGINNIREPAGVLLCDEDDGEPRARIDQRAT